MDIENFITEVSNLLPNFTIRILLLSFLLLWILLSNTIYIVFPKKNIKYLFSLLAYVLLVISIWYFAYTEYIKDIFKGNLLYLIIPISIPPLIYIFKYLLLTFKKNNLYTIVHKLENIFVLTLFTVLLLISLFARPDINVFTSSNSEIIDTTGEISIDFSIPVRKKDIKVNISPESTLEFKYTNFWNLENWITNITVVPTESFLPEQKIVVYTTGIQRIFPFGFEHENNQEFFTPKPPNVQEVVLGADIQNVSIKQPITLQLDDNDKDFVEWEAVFVPDAEFTIVRDNDDTVVIQPIRLEQGTEYKLEIIKSIIRYNTTTLQKTSVESQEKIKEILFRTAPAPGVESFNRNGVIISNSEPLIIYFQSSINEESIKDKLLITPQIEGTVSLSEDGKQVIFKPKTSFLKNTEYKITILSGLENKLGGYIENDIVLSFRTAGYVALSYASPRNGAIDIANTIKNISLTFNQPVDKNSVQERFTISPNVAGTFSWSGNTLYYNLSENLAYGTKYTVSIASGIKSLYGIDSSSVISSSFTTKKQIFLLNVPYYHQTEIFTCNLAATRMVLAYRGVSSTEAGIKSSIGIGLNPNEDWVDGYGVHSGPVSSYIAGRGVSNRVYHSWNLTGALQEVKNGNPVLIYIYNGSSQPKGTFILEGGYTGYKGMHSQVIVGFIGTPESPSTIIVNDPWKGKLYLSPSSFMSAWSYLGYTGIVIY